MKKQISFKLSLVIIIALIIITGSGILAWYLLTVEPLEEIETPKGTEEIDNWITYRDEDYGFKISFPKDWQIKEREESFNNSSFLISKKEDPREKYWSYILIYTGGRTVGIYGIAEERNTIFLGREAKELVYFTIEKDFWGKIISILSDIPESWGEYSNISLNVGMDNFEVICGDYYPDGSCVESEFIGYSGLIDKEEKKILEKILESFEFLEK